MDVLPEVVTAVNGRATIMIDGSFMRGTDVAKAIALGARCVGLGRLTCLGLAAAGVPGLVRALELLEEEIRICLMLLGVTSLAELTPAHLAAAPAVSEPAALSAFPLLGEGLGPHRYMDRRRRRRRSWSWGARGGVAPRFLVEDQPNQGRGQRRHVGDQQEHEYRRRHQRDQRTG